MNKKIIKICYFIFHINRYLLMGAIFLIWIIFFDKNSIINHYKINKKIEKMIFNRNILKKKFL